MSVLRAHKSLLLDVEDLVAEKKRGKQYSLTSFIVTICKYENILTPIDIQNFIECGLRVILIRSLLSKTQRLLLLKMFKEATKAVADKLEMSDWPIAISFILPNACIRTGCINEDIDDEIYLKEDSLVEITCNKKYWNKCDEHKIFIDDPYTFPLIKPGTEITMCFGEIVMFCSEIVSSDTVKCRIARGSILKNTEFVNIRGIKHKKPVLTKIDQDYLCFALENKFDVIVVNYVRFATKLIEVRKYFSDANCPVPLIAATICEQEGLDNIDEIIKEADFIILAREFLAHEIVNKHMMITIQLQISAKCKKEGIPLYISGQVLENTLKSGTVIGSEVTDITNVIMQGAGLMVDSFTNPTNVVKAMKIIKSISRTVEVVDTATDFWSLCMGHIKPPVNAAEACILACALESQRTKSSVIVIPTVTGKTAIKLSQLYADALIITVSINSAVAKRLLIYRGIFPLIYDQIPQKNWNDDMLARINYAVTYAIKYDILKYGDIYICLRKNAPTSSFCDCVNVCKVADKHE